MEQILGGPRGSIQEAVNRVCEVLGAEDGQLPTRLISAAGAKNGSTVTASEGIGLVRKTVLTLAATPISFADDAGVGQFGTLKLYDMPAGNVLLLGAVIDAALTLSETWWTNAAEGDVGLGTTAVDNGDALATTEQDMIATAAVAAMTAQVGPIDAQSATVLATAAAAGTDVDVNLNIRIDDAAGHMPDLVTNGAFASDTAWTKGTGWTITGGKGVSDGSQADVSDIAQAATDLVPGVSYVVVFTTSSVSAGTIKAYINGNLGTARSTSATFTQTIVAGASGGIALRADADFVGSVDNFTVTPVTGNGTISGTVTLTWANLGDIT